MRPTSKQPAHSCGKVKQAAEPRKDISKSLLFILFFFEHKSFPPKKPSGLHTGERTVRDQGGPNLFFFSEALRSQGKLRAAFITLTQTMAKCNHVD